MIAPRLNPAEAVDYLARCRERLSTGELTVREVMTACNRDLDLREASIALRLLLKPYTAPPRTGDQT